MLTQQKVERCCVTKRKSEGKNTLHGELINDREIASDEIKMLSMRKSIKWLPKVTNHQYYCSTMFSHY